MSFTKLATITARWTGKPVTFAGCVLIVVVWALTGPLFGYSDTWQLIINTGTTIVTFLMVFLIQNTQNRDGSAVQAKLDELIRVTRARNTFIGIEHLTEKELDTLHNELEGLAREHGDHDAIPHLKRTMGRLRTRNRADDTGAAKRTDDDDHTEGGDHQA